MSLIADALKKAQSARLGRRYKAPDPSEVLPRPGDSRGGAGQASLSSILNRIQLSPTLLVGLGSAIFLFAILFAYFFLFGQGAKGTSPVTTAAGPGGNQTAGLILAPPPSIPAVEPLILEGTEPAAKVGDGEAPKEKVSGEEKAPLAQAKAKPAASKVPRKAGEKSIAKAPEKESEPPQVAATPALSEEVRRHFNLALFYQEEKNFPQARRAYEKVVQMWPVYAEAHNNLGVVYKELGMYEQALGEFKKALALNPRYAMAYHNLGVVHQIKGEWKVATKSYDMVLSLDANHLGSYNNLGLVYRSQKRPHEAREILEKALAINPAFAQTHYNLALVLEDIGELERARFHFQKFIDLSGENQSPLVERVRAHLQALLTKK